MNKEVYLDNASTTIMCKEARDEIIRLTERLCGNPSSLHKKGIEMQEYIDGARENIARFINALDKEIYFTPSGTFSNNMAIIGAVRALKRRGNRIITTAIEHSSVLNVMKYLEQEGFEVIYIKPQKDGSISLEEIEKYLNKETILVSVMLINNEVGTIQPIREIKSLMKKKSPFALLHSDCVSAFGKIKIDVKNMGIDMLSASSHKVHGPCGVGLLYITSKGRVLPIVFGGGQEKGISPGTEPVYLISAFSKAVNDIDIEKENKFVKQLSEYAIHKLSEIEEITINRFDNISPYIINFSVRDINSETLLNYLSERNIFVASGSACAKGKQSHVLKAFGLKSELINSSIRISFSKDNSVDDIDILAENIKEALKRLTKRRKK